MQIEIDEKAVIPEQSLEGKIGIVAKITHVSPFDHKGERTEKTTFENAETVGVQIQNISDAHKGNSGQIYISENFTRFREAYGVIDPHDLVGKPVISVYTKDLGQTLTGLIPLNMDR